MAGERIGLSDEERALIGPLLPTERGRGCRLAGYSYRFLRFIVEVDVPERRPYHATLLLEEGPSLPLPISVCRAWPGEGLCVRNSTHVQSTVRARAAHKWLYFNGLFRSEICRQDTIRRGKGLWSTQFSARSGAHRGP